MPDNQRTDKVVSIGLANSIPPGEPCAQVVALLKEWLASAETGELIQVLIAGVTPGHGVRTEWAGKATIGDCLAAATGLQARVSTAWVSDQD